MRAEQDCELKESIVLEGRPELSDGRPAPLTVAQLDDLLGQRANQTRVVIGTPATGIAEVSHTLHTVAGRIDGWVLPPVGRFVAFRQALTGGSWSSTTWPGTRTAGSARNPSNRKPADWLSTWPKANSPAPPA